MKKIFSCRRTVTSLFAILCLTLLGAFKNVEVAAAISTIAIGLSAANSFEGSKRKKDGDATPS
jgi:hypothetical protein